MILQRHNYNMMNKEMVEHLSRESFGGNASTVEIDGQHYSCAGANSWIDNETGEIYMFGNMTEDTVSDEIRERGTRITFRVALDWKGEYRTFHGGFFRIVDTFGDKGLSPRAQKLLEACVDQYNTIQVKKIKKLA